MEKLTQMFLKYKQLAKACGGSLEFTFCNDMYNQRDNVILLKNKVIRAEFYKYILHLFDYDKLPELVSGPDFNKLNRPELLHGFVQYSHGRDYLISPIIFDSGLVPSGFYVTGHSHMPFAKGYTSKYEDDFPESAKRVLHVKLNTNKIVHYNYIEFIRDILSNGNYNDLPLECQPKMFEFINFINGISDLHERYEFMQLFAENYSNIAIYLGYDAMYGGFSGYDNGEEIDPEEIEIFNRGIVVAKQSKADFFTRMAQKEESSEDKKEKY